MDMLQLYSTNDDIKRYVDKYSACYGISVEEALKHALVKEYADLIKRNSE